MRGTLRKSVVLVALLAAVVAALTIGGLLRSVRQALAPPVPADSRPLQFVALEPPRHPLERWGGAAVEAVALTPDGLIVAGASGVGLVRGSQYVDLSAGLPTLAASSLALWRGHPVVGLHGGGLFVRRGDGWEEARSGFGTLHVRALRESEAGELLVGAREGLFRAAFGASSMERLNGNPVRGLSLLPGAVLAGGEEGLFRVEPRRTMRLETPDAWVDDVALQGKDVLAVTAAGLARGAGDGSAPLQPVAAGDDLVSGVATGGAFYGLDASEPSRVRRIADGRVSEEILPSAARRLLLADGTLFADTAIGLLRREAGSWKPAAPRPAALPPGPVHVTALALLGDDVVAGLFDGGLAVGHPEGGSLSWSAVAGSSAWGVNALLSAGGVVHVASLRGAARFDGRRLTPVEGPGAAFSLAATRDGLVIGYGQGVLLPGSRLLSAFHGLPGNQALALASGEELFVGTPSGLGAVDSGRVRWRVASGEGKLPHPWVTALALSGDELFVGTYGGGVVRRRASHTGPAAGTRVDPSTYEPFVETEGLKVNTGCLVEAGGRLYLGTDGHGLFRLSRDRARFVPLRLPLPSPRVTALLPGQDALLVGTDEGIARLPLEGRAVDDSTGAE
jgi:hypothetical protein